MSHEEEFFFYFSSLYNGVTCSEVVYKERFVARCCRCEYVPPLKDFTCAPMDN